MQKQHKNDTIIEFQHQQIINQQNYDFHTQIIQNQLNENRRNLQQYKIFYKNYLNLFVEASQNINMLKSSEISSKMIFNMKYQSFYQQKTLTSNSIFHQTNSLIFSRPNSYNKIQITLLIISLISFNIILNLSQSDYYENSLSQYLYKIITTSVRYQNYIDIVFKIIFLKVYIGLPIVLVFREKLYGRVIFTMEVVRKVLFLYSNVKLLRHVCYNVGYVNQYINNSNYNGNIINSKNPQFPSILIETPPLQLLSINLLSNIDLIIFLLTCYIHYIINIQTVISIYQKSYTITKQNIQLVMKKIYFYASYLYNYDRFIKLQVKELRQFYENEKKVNVEKILMVRQEILQIVDSICNGMMADEKMEVNVKDENRSEDMLNDIFQSCSICFGELMTLREGGKLIDFQEKVCCQGQSNNKIGAINNDKDQKKFREQFYGITKLPNCAHLFHQHCINKWIQLQKNSCPICRISIKSQQLTSQYQQDQQ